MMNELKNMPEPQKKILRLAITMTSALLLLAASALWFFQEDVMEMFGMDGFTINLIAGIMCVIVVTDLILLKMIIGEDKAK